MSKSSRYALSAVACAMALSACNAKSGGVRSSGSAPAPVASSVQAGANDKTPVARISGQEITNADLTAAAKQQLMKAEREYNQQAYTIRASALEELIEKRLVEAKAKSEGITAEALTKREIESKLAEPTDAEVQAFYDDVKAKRGGMVPPFDQVKPQVAAALKNKKEQEVRAAFFDKLKADAKVETLLSPPRVAVSTEGPSKGAANAPITIVEFSDFECPFCSRAEPAIKQVLDTYKDKVRLVFRDYPLPMHAKAPKASEAAHCAGDQGKYWEMHGRLFANQSALDVPQLKEHAKGIGLDQAKFDKCLDSGEKAKHVQDGLKAGEEAGVSGTPAFFINGRMLSGAQPFEAFKKVIDEELRAPRS